jgi:hypothetical protein
MNLDPTSPMFQSNSITTQFHNLLVCPRTACGGARALIGNAMRGAVSDDGVRQPATLLYLTSK